MQNIFNKIVFSSAIALAVVACTDKDLTVNPRQSIASETALTSVSSVDAAVIGTYSNLKAQVLYGRDFLALSDALSDISFATNKSGRLFAENRNNVGAHFAHWATSYSLINDANLVLAAVNNIPGASQLQKDRWEGECRFIRALSYFDLAKSYAYNPTFIVPAANNGGVVLRATPIDNKDSGAAFFPARASIQETYQFIINDLNIAATRLQNSARPGAPHFASRAACLALLSRVHLYNGTYAEAITAATAAMSAGVGTLASGAAYVNGWRAATNPESIFEVRFAIAAESLGVNVSLQTTYTSLAALGAPTVATGGFGDLVPNAFLLQNLGITGHAFGTSLSIANNIPMPALIKTTDVRNQLYEWGGQRTNPRFVECTKFIGKNGIINLDNVPVIRMSEMLLNRAEAFYQRSISSAPVAGDQANALTDLNAFLAARGLPAVSLTGTALFQEILRQRMLEFAFEGHRFHDLKRNGLDIIKAPVNVPANDFRILAPIPSSELIGNPNMRQNTGY